MRLGVWGAEGGVMMVSSLYFAFYMLPFAVPRYWVGLCAWLMHVVVCGAMAWREHTACPDEARNREDSAALNLARAEIVVANCQIKPYFCFRPNFISMKTTLLLSLLCMHLINANAQTRFYVNHQADSSIANGLSWATALTHVQQAFDIAASGDEIWIANGVYLPSLNNGRKSSFLIDKPLRVIGGFNGTEANITDRDIQMLGTTFSGEVGDTTRTDNLLTILTLDNCDTTTVFDGILFERGYAMEDTITVQGYYGPAHCGAAVYVKPNLGYSKPIFRNCSFKQNTAEFGGAIFTMSPDSSIDNTPAFYHCTFEENYGSIGNSIYVVSGGNSPFIVRGCSFLNNFSYYSSVLFLLHEKDTLSLVVDSCRFINNKTTFQSFSPGISIEYKHRQKDWILSYQITNSHFEGNHHASVANPTSSQIGSFFEEYTYVVPPSSTQVKFASDLTFENNTVRSTAFSFALPYGLFDTLHLVEAHAKLLNNKLLNASLTIDRYSRMQLYDNQLNRAHLVLGAWNKFESLRFLNNHLDSSYFLLQHESRDSTETSLSEIVNSTFNSSSIGIWQSHYQPLRVINFINNSVKKGTATIRNTRFCQNVIDSSAVQLEKNTVIGNTFKVSATKHVTFNNTPVLNNLFFNSFSDSTRQFSYQKPNNFDHNFINAKASAIDTSGFGKNNIFSSSQLPFGVFQSPTSTVTASCAKFKNAGTANPFQLLNTDFVGKPRQIECGVDIGAYELDSTVIDSFMILPHCTDGGFVNIVTQQPCVNHVNIQWVDPMGGVHNSGSSFFGVGPGPYELAISLSPFCPAIIDTIIYIPQYMTEVSILGDTAIQCGNTLGANITIQPSGGFMPYHIAWNDTTYSGFQLNNLPPGTYPYQVLDNYGCKFIDTLKIGVTGTLPILVSAAAPSCFGADDGWLCLQPLAGKSPFSWAWQQLSLDNICALNLTSGQYTCVISDAFGCSSLQSLNLYQPTEISIFSNITDALAGINNGAIHIFSTQGGTPPYTFDWSTNDTTNTISALSPGLYTVTVSDAQGCQLTSQFQVELISQINSMDEYPSAVVVWPNPYHQYFFVNVPTEDFSLYSVTGEKVQVIIDWFDKYSRVTTPNLPTGIYYWQCKGQVGKVLRI
jgi:SprB repeat